MDDEVFIKMKQFDKDNAERYLADLSAFIQENIPQKEYEYFLRFLSTTNAAAAFEIACEMHVKFLGGTWKEARESVLREMIKMCDSFSSIDPIDPESED